jgi:aminopeptidase N
VAPVKVEAAPPEPPPPSRDDGRLPALATALRYALSLDIDPNRPEFSGSVRILVRIPAATPYVVLHGRGLTVTQVSAQVGAETVAATVAGRTSHGGLAPEELVLTFARPLPAGEAVLGLDYRAPFADTLAGLARVNDGGRWYAFTQFEPVHARRAFPSFDEPDQKVPFDVHITTPKGLLAFSNMPETARTDRVTAAGTVTTFDFQTSPPLPTYLVALAVGDFDVRQGQTSPVPIRLITVKGKAALGGLALEDAAGILKELARYFGIAYPYPKLDIVAVPRISDDAMENAGFITFNEDWILLDPTRAPLSARMGMSSVIAHEEAHQWFGDLVTAAWWDDIWLNEGFATWMGDKISDVYHPAYRQRLTNLSYLGEVMATDSLRSARAVRQPVASTSEARESFDGITYTKGGAVLGMIEHMIGDDTFRNGVEAYLSGHAWKNATASDLFAALSRASGKDVGKLAATFLDRPGVPEVSIGLDCSARPPILTLSQVPWHLLGDSRDDGLAPWSIPVDLRASDAELHVLLADRTGTYPLPRCPAWVDPDIDAHGYYLYSLDEKRWAAFAAVIEKQSEGSRLAFLQSLEADVRSGTLGGDALLRLLPAFDADTSRVVLNKEIAVLGDLERWLVTPESRVAFASYAAARLLPHKRALDAKVARSKAAPSEDDLLARQAIFSALGSIAHDPGTLVEANRVALAWLADPASVDVDLAEVAVPMASQKAGPDRIEALRGAMRRANVPVDRQIALAALSGFHDPSTLQAALSLTLTDEVGAADAPTLIWPAVGRPATRAATKRWLTAHWDAFSAKVSVEVLGYVFGLTGQSCTREEIEEDRAFMTPRVAGVEGATRPLAEGLESAERCAALHEKNRAVVDRFFRVKPGPVVAPTSP